MRTWEGYKQTMRAEDPVFDLARAGDLPGLNALELGPERLAAKNCKGHSALMLSAYNGHLDVARFLIERGADVDSRDPAGSSVAMGAAFKGDLPMLRLLIDHGADPFAVNHRGQTALDFARAFGQAAVEAYLESLSSRFGERINHGQ